MSETMVVPVWRNLKYIFFKKMKLFLEYVNEKESKIEIETYVKKFLRHTSFKESLKGNFELYKISLSDLDIRENIFFQDFLFKLDTFNFDFPPMELALLLRADYLNQIPGEHLIVLSKPKIFEEGEGYTFFELSRTYNLSLDTISIKPNDKVLPEWNFVVLKKK